MPDTGVLVGTKGFVESFEGTLFQYMSQEMSKAFSEEIK
jgi:hypothetical protein